MKIVTKKEDSVHTSPHKEKTHPMKALLFINGEPPKEEIDIDKFDAIYCTDGAYSKALLKGISPDVVVGDFDSIKNINSIPKNVEILYRPNQNFTDFHKCLSVLLERGFKSVDVYGATGLEHDHFLGNLTTALLFKKNIRISFHDDFSVFFFAENPVLLEDTKNRIISIYPFPEAENVTSQGLFYPLKNNTLSSNGLISTRNHSLEDKVKITFSKGEMLVFLSKYRRDFS